MNLVMLFVELTLLPSAPLVKCLLSHLAFIQHLLYISPVQHLEQRDIKNTTPSTHQELWAMAAAVGWSDE